MCVCVCVCVCVCECVCVCAFMRSSMCVFELGSTCPFSCDDNRYTIKVSLNLKK